MIDRQVPLLCVCNPVRIKRSVERPILTVDKTGIDEGWFLSNGREALTQDQCRGQALVRTPKRGG